LMARIGIPYCPDCQIPVGTQTTDQIVDKILSEDQQTRLYLMAPLELESNQDYSTLWDEVRQSGFIRVRIDQQTHSLDELPELDRRSQHAIEVVVDRITVRDKDRARIAESVEAALQIGRGVLHVAYVSTKKDEPQWQVVQHSQHLSCEDCGRSFQRLSPHHFSFNSHLGWCESCEGLGTQRGANPAALLGNTQSTLLGGAVTLWPDLQQTLAEEMMRALIRDLEIDDSTSFDQLTTTQRRSIMHGTGSRWFAVDVTAGKTKQSFKFQFKGLYPTLEQASRVSPALRTRLEHLVDQVECSTCGGSRLRDFATAYRFQDQTMEQLCRLPLEDLLGLVTNWKLPKRIETVAGELLLEIQNRLEFLNEIGLYYLTLDRPAASLSNGEAQRIRLASQLGSGLCGVLYVLDEPTIGLHPRDNSRLLQALNKLRDLGNTLLVVEHDREIIQGADYLCDFGPGSGLHGGNVVAHGTPAKLAKQRKSVTGPYLSGKKTIPIPSNRRPVLLQGKMQSQVLAVRGVRHHNLKDVDLVLPMETLTVVTGPSGSGKSSLIDGVLYAALAKKLHRASMSPGSHDHIEGLELINKVIRVDQNALGNSPSSNPATYTGVFDLIRTLFSQLPDAKLRGFTARRFSFNVPGGRCDDCDGYGNKRIEMHFLPDVWIQCQTCHGKRYNPDTLEVKFRGRSIADVLEMTCAEAVRLFDNIPKIRRILQMLCDVGLDYVSLGQPAPTLSGGEAQRVKLAAELARPDTGRTLYLLDEPTTGLHFADIEKLLEVLHRLVDLGNTVVVIEHNLDLIKTADWVIDIGPEAG
ncbi:MAG: excinuclease ABC subunit UvrA, partial [Planctomycetaceae bacterium]|nr:excinuclease ABC subunit UvrA [Planctomycetaceae bacterium]